MLLLEELRWLIDNNRADCRLLLLKDGVLLEEFRDCVPTLVSNLRSLSLSELESLCNGIPDIICGNTAVAASVYMELAIWGVPIITQVNELESSLQKYVSPLALRNLTLFSNHYICASKPVADNLARHYGIPQEMLSVVESYVPNKLTPAAQDTKVALRKTLSLPQNDIIILGCGTQSIRKGVDIFLEVAAGIHKQTTLPKVSFCWLGAPDDTLPTCVPAYIEKLGDKCIFPGEIKEPWAYFQASDIFLLPSREDPFPLVALYAALCELPVICFADSGGIPDMLENDPDLIAPYLDTQHMETLCRNFIVDEKLRRVLGKKLRLKTLNAHTIDSAMPKILNIFDSAVKKYY